MFKEILREDKRNANSTTFDLPTALLKSCIYQWALDILSFFFFITILPALVKTQLSPYKHKTMLFGLLRLIAMATLRYRLPCCGYEVLNHITVTFSLKYKDTSVKNYYWMWSKYFYFSDKIPHHSQK